jgi:hypothetical protein
MPRSAAVWARAVVGTAAGTGLRADRRVRSSGGMSRIIGSVSQGLKIIRQSRNNGREHCGENTGPLGTLRWRASERTSLLAAYRYIQMDYDTGKNASFFEYDMSMSGPALGVAFTF